MRPIAKTAAPVALLALLAGCSPGNPLVGTWGSNTISADDMQSGVTTSDNAFTFNADMTLQLNTSKTYNAVSTDEDRGCTVTSQATGTYTTSGTNTIQITISAVNTTRVNCVDTARNVSNQPATTQELAFGNAIFSLLNTYSVSGTVLTLSSTSDGGINPGALVLMRRP